MLNQVLLVGRISHSAQLKAHSRVDYGLLLLEVKTSEKRESKTIPVHLSKNLKVQVEEYVSEGALVGVKAKLVMIKNELEVHAEKITFINDSVIHN